MPTLTEWRAFYDSWAGKDPRLASTGHLVPDADFARLGAAIAGWLDLGPQDRVLDVGCASGTLTSHWAARAGSALGVDFSSELVAEANRRHAGTQLAFVQGEAAELPCDDAAFDCVVCFNVLLSLPDHDYVDRAIGELLRVAKPAARLVLGSLPDARCQQRFFEVLRRETSAPRRVLGTVKSWLRGGRQPATKILWFDIPALQQRLEAAGFTVTVHDDPPFANYRHYRKSLVARRGAERHA